MLVWPLFFRFLITDLELLVNFLRSTKASVSPLYRIPTVFSRLNYQQHGRGYNERLAVTILITESSLVNKIRSTCYSHWAASSVPYRISETFPNIFSVPFFLSTNFLTRLRGEESPLGCGLVTTHTPWRVFFGPEKRNGLWEAALALCRWPQHVIYSQFGGAGTRSVNLKM